VKKPSELSKLARQRTWDKDVVLWIGTEANLLDAIKPVKNIVTLDILDLFDETNLPADDEETRPHLTRELRRRLKAIQTGPENRTVLVVKSIGLLARYKVGTSEFYKWFCGDFAMVVLLLEGMPEKIDWSDEMTCDPNRLLCYFDEPDAVKHVFSGRG
jgi:hypothetical protein